MNQQALVLFVLISFANLLQSQDYKAIIWHTEDSVNVNQITSIFKEVVTWDGDTTLETRNKRANLADQLWAYYQENAKKESGEKALFYSFAISLRNEAYQQICDRYQSLELDGEFWKMIYLFYRQALKRSRSPEEVIEALKSELESVDQPTKEIQITYDLGFWNYNIGELEEAEKYFTRTLQLTENRSDFQKEKRRASDYLDGLSGLKIGKAAQNFERTDITGKEIELEEYQGKVVILDFWATWCVPCREELPELKTIYQKYHSKGLEIIGISLDTDLEKLKNYINAEEIDWRQIYAKEGKADELVKKYSAFGLPTYYIIDQAGRIRYNNHSRSSGVEIKEVIAALMEN